MEIKTHRSIDMAATGRNILRLRKSHGYSVSDIQDYFGFAAPQAIYKWEKGQSLPSTDNLYDLSFLLGVPMEEILVAREYEIKSEPRDSRGSGRFGDLKINLKLWIFRITEYIQSDFLLS